jgi:hypothetical protein
MNTQQPDIPAKRHAGLGFRRRLAVGVVAMATLASLALPGAGSAAEKQSVANQGTLKLPPGWCYYEPFGGYYPCPFITIEVIWPD